MRDVAKRRGVVRVVDRLPQGRPPRRARIRTGVRFRRAARRRRSAGTRKGRLMIPAIALYALVPGDPRPGDGRPPAADRLPGRELRRARLRLTGSAAPYLRGRWPASSIRSRPSLDGLRRRRRRGCWPGEASPSRRPTRPVDDRAPVRDRRAQRPRRRAGRRRSHPAQADPGRAGLAAAGRVGGHRSAVGRAGARRPRRPGVVLLGGVVLAIGRPTTWPPRAPPGRGCRSRSGSRCCRSTAGTGRPGTLPAFFVVLRPDGGRRRGGAGDRQRPGRSSTRTATAGRARSRRASGPTGRGASTLPGRVLAVRHRLGSSSSGRVRVRRSWPSPRGRAAPCRDRQFERVA